MSLQIKCFMMFTCVALASAWFETCNHQYSIPAAGMIVVSQNYPNRYPIGSSCKWYILATTGYTVNLQCTYNLTTSGKDCQSQQFYVSREGDKALNNANYYCGYGTIDLTSVGPEISLGYTSNPGGNGWIYCNATRVLTTQSNCQCGWNKNARIVGGSNAQPNEYVSMAALVDITAASDRRVFCGSAIISEAYSLTAAHCFNIVRLVQILLIGNIKLLVGDNDISSGTDTPYSALYTVISISKHPGYVATSSSQKNDIALVKTDPIKWKKTIGPACLPFSFTDNAFFVGKALTVLGWGATSVTGSFSNILKKTSLSVISSLTCDATYGDIFDGKFCTYTAGTDTCQGDLGGNLYWTANGSQYTIGVASYGQACGSTAPSVATRVTYYLNWILSKMPGAFVCRK